MSGYYALFSQLSVSHEETLTLDRIMSFNDVKLYPQHQFQTFGSSFYRELEKLVEHFMFLCFVLPTFYEV